MRTLFSIIAAGLFTVSCESVLFIELEEADKLIVVNGAISSDSTIRVQVSRTRHILDNAEVYPLSEAVVKLYEEGSLLEELSYESNGYFAGQNFIPEVGVNYTIEVENPLYPSVFTSSRIPPAVMVESLDTSIITIEYNYDYWSSTETVLQFDLTLDDPQGVENYYLLNAMADRSYSQWRDTTVVIVDSLYYGNQWNYYPRDSTYTLTDIVRVEEAAHISSNDIVVEATTQEGILFSDQLIDGKKYSFRGQILSWSIQSADSAVVDFKLHSISESYYKYLKSRQKHYETKDNYLAVPVIVYSNVDGGTGFFGAYSSDVYTITTFIPEYNDDYWYYERY